MKIKIKSDGTFCQKFNGAEIVPKDIDLNGADFDLGELAKATLAIRKIKPYGNIKVFKDGTVEFQILINDEWIPAEHSIEELAKQFNNGEI